MVRDFILTVKSEVSRISDQFHNCTLFIQRYNIHVIFQVFGI